VSLIYLSVFSCIVCESCHARERVICKRWKIFFLWCARFTGNRANSDTGFHLKINKCLLTFNGNTICFPVLCLAIIIAGRFYWEINNTEHKWTRCGFLYLFWIVIFLGEVPHTHMCITHFFDTAENQYLAAENWIWASKQPRGATL